jgi:hypothetical protein
MRAFRRGELLVFGRVHQLLEVLQALLGNLHLGDPPAAVRVVLGDLVDGAGLLLQREVDLGDLARDRGVDVGRALDRLDGADGVAGLRLPALFRQLDVDNVAQRLGGILADAQNTRLFIRREVNPLVLLGVFPYRVYITVRSQRVSRAGSTAWVARRFLTCGGHGEGPDTDCAGSGDDGKTSGGPGDP